MGAGGGGCRGSRGKISGGKRLRRNKYLVALLFLLFFFKIKVFKMFSPLCFQRSYTFT